MVSEDPWYEIVDGTELEQGDFISYLPTFVPEYSSDLIQQLSAQSVTEWNISAKMYRYNVVVMSQSCDLEQRKLRFVLVCPYWSLEDLGRQEKKFLEPKIQEEIRKGNMYSYHMLNECRLDEKKQGIQVVEFKSVFSVPFDFLTSFANAQGKRLRLRSPYKEKLSHAFGNSFSRVALPVDIPSFSKK